MAEGYLRHFASAQTHVYSAGIETHGLNPHAVAIMAEDGIDIAHHTSNNISEYYDIPFDLVLTVCDHAQENCPWFPGRAKRIHHNFKDPSKLIGTDQERHTAFQQTRDEIKTFCQKLAASHQL
jgi:arsenate reductase